jgi:GntR family transcriptional regulator
MYRADSKAGGGRAVPANKSVGDGQNVAIEFLIETDSYVPYYQQIVDQVRAQIKAGGLKDGDTFHSEGEIAARLGISKMPVRQAFLKLRSEGLLVIEKGKRPVIGSGQVPWNFQQLRGFSEEMRRRGLEPSAKVLSLKRAPASPEIAAALHLKEGEALIVLQRLRYVDQQPVAVVTSYLPALLFPDIEREDLEKSSLYYLFEKVYRRKLSWAEEEIGATTASEEIAGILDTAPGSALLLVRETTFDVKRTAIEHSVSLLRADRYTATVVSLRKR